MGTRALPDMYALSPRACGPRASGIHIRQSTRARVITYTNKLNVDKNTTYNSISSHFILNHNL